MSMKSTLLILLALCLSLPARAQGRLLTGLIQDTSQTPIAGASIREEGTSHGCLSDNQGRFRLQLRGAQAKITVSCVGFVSQTISIDRQRPSDPLVVTLLEDTKLLGDVVVTAYGAQQLRGKITTSISSVRNETLAKGLFSNPAQALSGAVSGLRVLQLSGSPGATPSMILRGGTSLTGEGSPLVVIDGQVRSDLSDINPEDIEQMQVMKDAGATAIYGARANNGVLLITTKRGKAGYSEIRFKAKVSANVHHDLYEYLGAEDYIRLQRIATRDNAQIYKNSAGDYVGFGDMSPLTSNVGFGTGHSYYDPQGQPYDGNKSPEGLYGLYEYEDRLKHLLDKGWKTMTDPVTGKKLIYSEFSLRKENIREVALRQDYNLSFTGGNDRGNYYANLGYNHSEGNALIDWYKRVSLMLNADYKIRPWLTTKSSVSFSRAAWDKLPNGENADADYFGRMSSVPPTFRGYNDKGERLIGLGEKELNWRLIKDAFVNDHKTNKLSLNQSFVFGILSGLDLKVSGLWFFRQTWREDFEKDHLIAPGLYNRTRKSTASAFETLDQTYNAVLNYQGKLHGHHINALVGTEYYDSYTKVLSASGEGAQSDDFGSLSYTSDEKGMRKTSTAHTRERILSYFGQVNYDYADRYLLSLVSRYDGYSRLIEHRWSFFPGISGGWVFTREPFFKSLGLSDVLSFGKLRVSYGSNGNVSGIGPYSLRGSYNLSRYGGKVGIGLSQIPNPYLLWEKTNTFEVGGDFGLWDNRLTLNLTYYNRITSDQIADITLPSHTGINQHQTNNGQLRNRGFELDLSAKILTAGDWRWSVNFNAGVNKNTILKLPYNGLERNRQDAIQVYTGNGNEKAWVGGLQEGQSPGDIYAFQADGLYRSPDEIPGNLIDKMPARPLYGPKAWEALSQMERDLGIAFPIQPGDVRWRDVNGDGVIDQFDQVKVGNKNPWLTGGLSTELSYRGLSLSIRMDYAVGHHVTDYRTPEIMGNAREGANTITLARDHTYSESNRQAKYPRYLPMDIVGKFNYNRPSSMFIYRGDYLALREISLSYQLPKAWTKRLSMTSLELSFTAQNLGYLTAAKYVYSPEPGASGWGGYALPRVFMLGLNVGL